MFDFLRKKIKKTVKDASDIVPEEETQSERLEELDSLEEELASIEEKYTTTEDEEEVEQKEETTTTQSDDEETEEEIEEEVEEVREEAEETTTEEEETEEAEEAEEEIEEEAEEVEEEPNETTTEEEEAEEVKEEPEEKKQGRFGFFRRKDKKEEKEETTTKDETKEEVKEVTKATEDEAEESKEETKETKKQRFGFFRKKDKEEKTETETPKDEQKEEKVEPPKQEKPETKEEKGGMFSFITTKTITAEDIEDILDELLMSLLEGDVAYEVAEVIVEDVKEDLIGRKIKRRGDMEQFTIDALKNAIRKIIDNGSYDLLGDIEESKNKGEPYKIMFVGINGTGKTTTIAKMAKYLEKHGYSSVFGASDTFRAGAIEQLEHHANNLNLKIIKHARNSDPAAVAYDAVDHARATGKDVVLIDTSGRMQTNINLMDEMKKIKRVSQPDIIIYVGDALMGNDATQQATKFNEVIDIDGIILTKADADAKGGAALSIGHVINKPILFIGTGQSYDDLMEFDPEWMLNQIFDGGDI